jgi:hypothetical protein
MGAAKVGMRRLVSAVLVRLSHLLVTTLTVRLAALCPYWKLVYQYE